MYVEEIHPAELTASSYIHIVPMLKMQLASLDFPSRGLLHERWPFDSRSNELSYFSLVPPFFRIQ